MSTSVFVSVSLSVSSVVVSAIIFPPKINAVYSFSYVLGYPAFRTPFSSAVNWSMYTRLSLDIRFSALSDFTNMKIYLPFCTKPVYSLAVDFETTIVFVFVGIGARQLAIFAVE